MKYFEFVTFDEGSYINLKLPGKDPIEGKIVKGDEGYYLEDINGWDNSVFISAFGKKAEFVDDIVKYNCSGNFPEVKTLSDLKKVLEALEAHVPSISSLKITRKYNIKFNFKL